MPIGIIVLMFLGLSVAINRAYYGEKSLTLKAGEALLCDEDGCRVVKTEMTEPVEPDVPLPAPPAPAQK